MISWAHEGSEERWALPDQKVTVDPKAPVDLLVPLDPWGLRVRSTSS